MRRRTRTCRDGFRGHIGEMKYDGRENMRRKIFFILMILWMAAIFAFSARSGDESAKDSYFVGTMAGKIFVPGFDGWSAQRQQEFAERIDHPVRKTAHASEYALLALLAAGVCIPEGNKKEVPGKRSPAVKAGTVHSAAYLREGFLLPWGIATAYAATDEIHQLFVPERSGQISDVMIDSAGALAGVAVLAVIRYLVQKRQQE